MIGRKLAISQCAEPADISPTHRIYRYCLAEASTRALLEISTARPSRLFGRLVAPWYDITRAIRYARKLMALRKRANRRRMARGSAPWCVLCGAEVHFDNSDVVRHMSRDNPTNHKARI